MSVAFSEDTTLPHVGILTDNNQMVDALKSALSTGKYAFSLVPGSIKNLILENAWMARQDHGQNVYTFGPDEFRRFLETPSPKGIGTTVDEVRKYLGESDNPVRVMFERLIARSQGSCSGGNNPTGRNQHTQHQEVDPNVVRVNQKDIIPFSPTSDAPKRDRSREPQAGNSVGYAVRRLGRERPDLLAKVEQGELSANAAAIEAGFRKPSINLPIEPEAAVRLIVKHFKGEALSALIRGLANWAGIDTAPPDQ